MPSKLFRPITTSASQSPGVQLPANFDKLKGIYAMMLDKSNGQAVMQNLLQTAMANNPTLSVLINANNGDYKAAFYALAQQQGKDPNQIASVLQEALQ